MTVALSPVTHFEGVWALPDGTLRGLERRGEQVALFSLAAVDGERSFLRFFEFVAADSGLVTFLASEEHVDPRGPDEPSCHVKLRAEYAYDVDHDALSRRQERVQLDMQGGRCIVQAQEWGESVALSRRSHTHGGPWVESTAGAGNVDVPEPQQNEPEPPRDPGDDKSAPREKKKATKKKPAPAKDKDAFDEKNPPQKDSQNQKEVGNEQGAQFMPPPQETPNAQKRE